VQPLQRSDGRNHSALEYVKVQLLGSRFQRAKTEAVACAVILLIHYAIFGPSEHHLDAYLGGALSLKALICTGPCGFSVHLLLEIIVFIIRYSDEKSKAHRVTQRSVPSRSSRGDHPRNGVQIEELQDYFLALIASPHASDFQ
jgi:hypothetical protein